jgi:hypothetical protein
MDVHTEDTYCYFLRKLNLFGAWLTLVKQETGTYPVADVPDFVTTNLRDLLVVLGDCVAWYGAQRGDDGGGGGDGELKRMFDILKAMLGSFEAGPRGQSGAHETSSPASDKIPFTFPDRRSPEVWPAIIVYCYLKDITDNRLLARQAWEGYKDRTVSLQTASLVANAALARIRTLNESLCTAFPGLRYGQDDYMHGNLVTFLHKRGLSFDQQDAPVGLDNSTDLAEDFQTMNLSDVVCFRMARSLANIFLNNTETVTRSFVDGALPDDSASRPIALTDADNALFRCLVQLRGLPAEGEGFWTHDYTWQASVALIDEVYCDTWIVFAAQMLWDAQCVLGDDAQRAVGTLEIAAEDLRNCILDDPETSTVEEARDSLVDRIDETSTLRPLAQSDEQEFSSTYCIKKTDKRFDLLAKHPALCGLKLAELDLEFHKLCVGIASDAGHILAVAHLYKALNVPEWDAMKSLIAAQGEERIFGDAPPVDMEDCIESASKALGINSGKTRKKRAQPNGTPRALGYMSRRSEVSERPVPSGGTAGRSVLMMLLLMAHDFTNQATPNIQATPSTRTSFILDSFFQAISNDEAALKFDVLGLHKTCAKLLGDIKQTHKLEGGLNNVVVEVLKRVLGGEGDEGSATLGGYAEEALRKVIAEANEKQERAEAKREQEREESRDAVEDVGEERKE